MNSIKRGQDANTKNKIYLDATTYASTEANRRKIDSEVHATTSVEEEAIITEENNQMLHNVGQ